MPTEAMLSMRIGGLKLSARLELVKAPKTCAAFRRLLPLQSQIIQARWSGEAAWIPLGEPHLGLDYENQTSYPAPGEILLYPGGKSEVEILLPYGATRFASKAGQLVGNHVATILDGRDALAELGRLVLWSGAQEIVIEEGSSR